MLFCNVVGILAHNACLAPQLLERATRSLAHRGSDDSGFIILHDAVPGPLENWLCATRLAILDLSALAHQSMQDKATGNSIVYNGRFTTSEKSCSSSVS
jgi:asparagine synthetase B (glutamine-hydrolysing)